jgi:hypothetical protein
MNILLNEVELSEILTVRVNQLLDINHLNITDVARNVYPNDEDKMNSFRGTISHIKNGSRGLPSYFNLYKLFIGLPGLKPKDIFKLNNTYFREAPISIASDQAGEYGKSSWLEEKLDLQGTIIQQHAELRECYNKIKQLESELAKSESASS